MCFCVKLYLTSNCCSTLKRYQSISLFLKSYLSAILFAFVVYAILFRKAVWDENRKRTFINIVDLQR